MLKQRITLHAVMTLGCGSNHFLNEKPSVEVFKTSTSIGGKCAIEPIISDSEAIHISQDPQSIVILPSKTLMESHRD